MEAVEFFRAEIERGRFRPVVNAVFELVEPCGVETLHCEAFNHEIGFFVRGNGQILRKVRREETETL